LTALCPDVTGYLWFKGKSAADLQPVVNRIVEAAFPKSTATPLIDASYAGSMVLKVPTQYVRMVGHDLEAKLRGVFKPLNKHEDAGGKLMRFISETVFVDYPEFIPQDLIDAFRGILSAPSHLAAKEVAS
jgi:hypothetical protein